MASESRPLALPPETLIQRLLRAGEDLPRDLRSQLLAQRDAMVPRLVEILADESLLEDSSPDGGWAPIHAAQLLGEMQAEQAIPRLIELAAEDPLALISDEAIKALRRMGKLVVEPILAVLGTTDNDDLRTTLTNILVDTGSKDERIFALLERAFAQEPEPIAGALGKYGDERAIPLLTGFLERYQMSTDGTMMDDHVLVEVRSALQDLGAELTPAQQAILDRFTQEQERRRQAFLASLEQASAVRRIASAPATSTKVGRNDPCPCGSGKKYKKCCGQ